MAYNALGQRTQIARFQSTGTANPVATTDFTYDTANRLSGMAHKQGATNLNTYAYTYDPLSRLASVDSTLDGLTSYNYHAFGARHQWRLLPLQKSTIITRQSSIHPSKKLGDSP
jgi:YD repeat-containing protein